MSLFAIKRGEKWLQCYKKTDKSLAGTFTWGDVSRFFDSDDTLRLIDLMSAEDREWFLKTKIMPIEKCEIPIEVRIELEEEEKN